MIGIIGSGLMGKGIAIELARFGRKVVLVSAQRHLDHDSLLSEIDRVSKKYPEINLDEVHKNIYATNELSFLADCSVVIEAVSENIVMKRQIIQESLNHTKVNCIYASNTSSLSIFDIFNGLVDLKLACGFHFFNPVQIMKLVEISYLEETSENTIHEIKKIAEEIGKDAIVVKNSPGFIVNRLLIPLINEASKILDEGLASAEDIDKAMRLGANHPIGPLKLSDLIGNDITLLILKTLKQNQKIEISPGLEDKVNKGMLGRKSKKGFYQYDK